METLELEAPYSSIIRGEDYNQILSKEHLYIAEADQVVAKFIATEASKSSRPLEVVELGCGPARVSPLLSTIKNIQLTGVDHDIAFIDYAKRLTTHLDLTIALGDITTYQHSVPVDVFCSIGVHHHIPKGQKTNQYLQNAYNQLIRGGYYLLSDEFLPTYSNEREREIRLVVWYFHIIASALRMGYRYLAEEEAKTFLDDINMGGNPEALKTKQQIDLVLAKAPMIDEASMKKEHDLSSELAKDFLVQLEQMNDTGIISEDHTLALSRRDYKICDQVLREEIEPIGFIIENVTSIGHIEHIGAMSVYVLKKP